MSDTNTDLSVDEKLDAIMLFIRKFEKIAELMSKHPMLAGMMPQIKREVDTIK